MNRPVRNMNVRRRRRPAVLAGAATLMMALLLTACGGTDASGGSGGGGDDDSQNVRISVTSGIDLGDVVGVDGVIDSGKQFGVEVSQSDITRFDSHATAVQVLLSGRAEVLSGSFASGLALIEKGQGFKTFCPLQNATAEQLVGLDDVDSIEALQDDGTRLAIDSSGGAANFFLETLLASQDAGFTISDLPSVRILEDGGQRFNAMQNGSSNITMLDLVEVEDLAQAIGEDRINVISTLAEDIGDSSIYLTYAATDEWLGENKEAAAQFCAAVMASNKAASEDFATYEEIVETYIEPPPAEREVKAFWDLANRFIVWPTDPVIDEDEFDLNVKVAVDSGLIESPIAYEDAMDLEVMERAREILEENGS